MNHKPPPVYFFIPPEPCQRELPTNAGHYWTWRSAMGNTDLALGRYDWTLQVYLHLHDRGFPCEIVTEPPRNGIVVSHYDFLSQIAHPTEHTLLVCIKADRTPHPYAQFHVVQNPRDHLYPFGTSTHRQIFLRHILQSGLIPRTAGLDRFRTVAYVGSSLQIASEFSDPWWARELHSLGFEWRCETRPERWLDYREIDILLAVRKCRARDWEFNHKPASKLYNAWNTNIPALLGVESAYRAERTSEFDFCEVTTPGQALKQLCRLRDNPNLRKTMLNHGRTAAARTTNDAVANSWIHFLSGEAVQAYHQWVSSAETRNRFYNSARQRIRLSRLFTIAHRAGNLARRAAWVGK